MFFFIDKTQISDGSPLTGGFYDQVVDLIPFDTCQWEVAYFSALEVGFGQCITQELVY